MKQKMTNKNAYEKICANCFSGRICADREKVLCVRQGIMDPGSTCRHYRYDPLKRRPKKVPTLPEYNPDEFAL